MYSLLWVLAVICIVFGILRIISGEIAIGLILLVIGLGIGPGGWAFYH